LPDQKSFLKEWDSYWQTRQTAPYRSIYGVIAAVYRKLLIRPFLNRLIRLNFSRQMDLLHTGCGGGMVDDDVAGYANLTALDFSSAAIASYAGRHGEKAVCVVADIRQMAIKDSSFDGIYNLGVMEHFLRDDHDKILSEFKRILKPGGKILLIWPPRFGSSVIFLKFVHWLANDVLKKNIHLHPPEPSLIKSRKWLEQLMDANNFEIVSYYLGPRDMFTQCAIIARAKN